MTTLDALTFPLHGQQLIEASAGTGKTYTITSLYLRLLLGRDQHLTRPLLTNEILVLTFTIAATDELRERIRNRVSLAYRTFAGEVGDDQDAFIESLVSSSRDITTDRRLLAAALQSMDEAAIFTIHGFCARILSEQSFDTGMLFNLNLDGDQAQFLQLAAEDCFRQEIMSLPSPNRDFALSRFSSPEQLANKTKRYLFRHNLQQMPADTDVTQELETLLADDQRCREMWLSDDILQLLRDANFSGARKTVKRLDANHDEFIGHYLHGNEFDPLQWEPWTVEVLEKATKADTVMPQHPVFELMDAIFARRHLVDMFTTHICHQVTRKLRNNLHATKLRLGQITLDDLLVEVHRALELPDLAKNLRQKWPVAMIDEFQDTDERQLEIFTRIYPSTRQNTDEQDGSPPSKEQSFDTALLFIGDPKQAIYNFRGADVYTYINAKKNVRSPFSLDTNWRSTPLMIEAVNQLFDQPNVFGNDQLIPFEPVKPAPNAAKKGFYIHNQVTVPMPLIIDQETTAQHYLTNLMEHAAEETAKLLSLAQQGLAMIDGKPVSPGQIAFLVRQGTHAKAARRALARRNIRSVHVTQESVMLSETARDLGWILEAVLEPTNESAIRVALSTQLMHGTAADIDQLNQNWPELHQVMQEFQHYHLLWSNQEFALMIDQLMSRRRLAQKWLNQPDGERQITNLRHLTEILQTRSMIAPGMRRLLKWFSRERTLAETQAADDRQLRLESDSDLVQIVTMHASKGLEYDIVMIPYAGFGEPRAKSDMPLFHIEDAQHSFSPVVDFSGSDASNQQASLEDYEETMRLLYVAMTRARYQCSIGFALSGTFNRSPLAQLLGLSELKPTRPKKNSTEDEINKAKATFLNSVLSSLTHLPAHLFDVNITGTTQTTRYQTNIKQKNVAPPLSLPNTQTSWRMHSYTGLTRLLTTQEATATSGLPQNQNHQHGPHRPGIGDDDLGNAERNQSTLREQEVFSRFNFIRGPRVGIALHEFMEHLDFSADEQQIELHANRCLGKLGQVDPDGQWAKLLSDWFTDIVHTPLASEPEKSKSISNNFSLHQIDRQHRLDEMEFHFPIEANQTLIENLRHEGVLEERMQLKVDVLAGMMTGYIDLIVSHNDQFFLVDYKSNDLGPEQSHYQPNALKQAVQHHHYNLQYLIYCVALNRHLKLRVSNYDYNKHFGGVYYLFLRGMDGQPGSGVFADKPEVSLIEKLDALLTKTPVRQSQQVTSTSRGQR